MGTAGLGNFVAVGDLEVNLEDQIHERGQDGGVIELIEPSRKKTEKSQKSYFKC